jgi:protein-tyrosine-phosphatase
MGKSILFVCTGNTCRSIMAEALARQWAETFAPDRGLNFISAGLAAWPDQPASHQAVETMRETGVDITRHRARQVSAELVRKADLILTMTGRHKKMLLATFPESADKVYTLVEFAVGDGDISDPYGRPVEVYRRCAGEMRLLIEKALHKIIRQ